MPLADAIALIKKERGTSAPEPPTLSQKSAWGAAGGRQRPLSTHPHTSLTQAPKSVWGAASCQQQSSSTHSDPLAVLKRGAPASRHEDSLLDPRPADLISNASLRAEIIRLKDQDIGLRSEIKKKLQTQVEAFTQQMQLLVEVSMKLAQQLATHIAPTGNQNTPVINPELKSALEKLFPPK
jgi:hypothetical protein